jgi:hypothetical protein
MSARHLKWFGYPLLAMASRSVLQVRYTACNARKKNAWNMNEMNKINKVLVYVK